MKRFALTFAAALAFVAATAHAADPYEEAVAAIEAGQFTAAMSPLLAAAEAGDARAEQSLAVMFLYGEDVYKGVMQDSRRARVWLVRLAARGDEWARYTLAQMDANRTAQAAR